MADSQLNKLGLRNRRGIRVHAYTLVLSDITLTLSVYIYIYVNSLDRTRYATVYIHNTATRWTPFRYATLVGLESSRCHLASHASSFGTWKRGCGRLRDIQAPSCVATKHQCLVWSASGIVHLGARNVKKLFQAFIWREYVEGHFGIWKACHTRLKWCWWTCFFQKISMVTARWNSGVLPLDVDAEVETFEVMSDKAAECWRSRWDQSWEK